MKNINEFCTGEVANISDFKQLPIDRHENVQAVMSESSGVEINKVFAQLQTIFPAWKQAFPDQKMLNAAKLQWSKALIEAGVCSLDQIGHGFRKARKSDIPFFPSPGMFISWCTPSPEDYGMPSPETALQMVIRRTITPETHPIVITVARHTKWERQTLDADEYKKIFNREYEIQMRRVMAGEQIGEVAKGIEHQKEKQKMVLTPTGYKIAE